MKDSTYWNIIITEMVYKFIRLIGKPFVFAKFNPIILNANLIPPGGPIIFTPNHRETLDPIIIISATEKPIHWAALKRFFTGEDSIFNNNKNYFLCKFTTLILKSIGAVSIDRDRCNISSVKKLNTYLKMGSSIGIFPEGTTNKNPRERDILPFKLEILHFAKKNNAWIQPISIVWMPKEVKKNRVIINFRPPFKIENMDISKSSDKLINSIILGIKENEQFISDLIEETKKYN
ncbi:1-acyl-sn-glycerol-3-phosphate acyltransferase [Dehalobacter sp. DCM]|uniref:lysophospholipid acyltransferase family protein n=1 Tax=Dehalobacter sp. DCM TaxID=2907827 RepID=UPI0030819DDE|nr:1-acyl-sn-glycerol-3-phosphate acyltransferase [Dehalobacter sp. DCM]